MKNIIKWSITAIKDILVAKVRSALTILGILVGISSVILMVDIGESTKKAIHDSIAGIGNDVIYVMFGSESDSKMSFNPTLFFGGFNKKNYKAVLSLKDLSFVDKIAARSIITAKVSTDTLNQQQSIWAVTEDYFDVINFKLISGRYFETRDFIAKERVVILGSKAAQEFFPREEALNKTITIDGKNFKVIGIVERESSMSSMNTLNEVIFIPFETANTLFKIELIQIYIVKLTSNSYTKLFENQLRQILTEDFFIQTQEDLLEESGDILSILTIFISLIAGISLIVGGIGVMNIMLVSVKEKIREVGLRKAVGATDKDILMLFLIQSIIYNLIGAFLGIVFGNLGAYLITLKIKLPFVISYSIMIYSVLISFVVGIIFGVYPAIIASRLSPVEALREE